MTVGRDGTAAAASERTGKDRGSYVSLAQRLVRAGLRSASSRGILSVSSERRSGHTSQNILTSNQELKTHLSRTSHASVLVEIRPDVRDCTLAIEPIVYE